MKFSEYIQKTKELTSQEIFGFYLIDKTGRTLRDDGTFNKSNRQDISIMSSLEKARDIRFSAFGRRKVIKIIKIVNLRFQTRYDGRSFYWTESQDFEVSDKDEV